MIRFPGRIFLGGCWGLFLFCGCDAKKEDSIAEGKADLPLLQQTEKGPVAVKATVAPPKPRLSDLVRFQVEIRAEPKVKVTPPAFGKAVGDFLIRDFREEAPRVEGEKMVRTFTYKLEPNFAGKHLIRPLEVCFVDEREGPEGQGKKVSLEVPGFEVEVSSEFAGGAPDLAKLSPMVQPRPLPTLGQSYWGWRIGGGVLGLLLAGAGVWYFIRRPKVEKAPELSPEEWAYAELEAMMRARMPEAGLVVEFYVALTGTVRRYIERVTGIHAPEQTTEEFLRAMGGDGRFDPQKARQLRSFLEACDLVKYAAQRPGAPEIEDAFRKAQEFVGLRGGGGLLRALEREEAVMEAKNGRR